MQCVFLELRFYSILFMVSRFVNFVSVFGGAELGAEFTRVSGGDQVGGLHVFPEAGPDIRLPAAAQTLPAPRVTPGHLSLDVCVQLLWNKVSIVRSVTGEKSRFNNKTTSFMTA